MFVENFVAKRDTDKLFGPVEIIAYEQYFFYWQTPKLLRGHGLIIFNHKYFSEEWE